MKRSLVLLAAVVVAVSIFILSRTDDRIGVVVMHGKSASAAAWSPVGRLAIALQDAGFLVAAPDMPWSKGRGFDRTFAQSMAEIDAAVEGLRARGAKRIVVGGHSMGAAAALGYAARRPDIAGILAIAPGHFIDIRGYQRRVGHDYRRARRLIESGAGDRAAEFRDLNQGRESTVEVSAKIYASWYDPEGPAAMMKNAAALGPGTALLWIFGERDRLNLRRGRSYAFDRAPQHPNSAYVVLGGEHRMTPIHGESKIIAWLEGL